MDLSGKKVAVYGLGVSGKGALQFLKDQDLKEITVVNLGDPSEWEKDIPATKASLKLLAQEDDKTSDELCTVDFILLAPGIPRSLTQLKKAAQKGIPIWNEIELASRFFQKPILALTGTNGKTTCVSFMAEVFRGLGKKAFVGGNIGRSFLEGLSEDEDYDLALLEISSFQCESFETFKPEIAGILNLFPNHGERYESVEDYRQAKWLLASSQTEDDVIYAGPGTKLPDFEVKASIKKIEERSDLQLEKEFDLSKLKIVGAHNRYNLWFCWQMMADYGKRESISEERMRDAFQKAIDSFRGVEHRIEYVGENKRFRLYNDAKSTNWEATLTALHAMGEKEGKTWLLVGGQLRGHNDQPPVDFLKFCQEQEIQVIAFGEASQKIGSIFPFQAEDLRSALSLFERESESGTKVNLILSPAFPSFDQFKNYAERGKAFKEMAEQLLSKN